MHGYNGYPLGYPLTQFSLRELPNAPSTGVRKYVVLVFVCGSTSILLGLVFFLVYFILRSYTTSAFYFETIPTFVPASLLILTGFSTILLARRRNRFSILLKISGILGIGTVVASSLKTITTTVIHMSRLQSLRECIFQEKLHTCTCFTHIQSSMDEDMRAENDRVEKYIFESKVDCDISWNSIYNLYRAIFGLSVAGVLVGVFSCMLVYQLLNHERKKMYWEQLELRCRTLYSQPTTVSSIGALLNTINVGCCDQCQAHSNFLQNFSLHSNSPLAWFDGQSIGNFHSHNYHLYPQTPSWNWFSPVQPSYGYGPPPPYSYPNSPNRRALIPSQNSIQPETVQQQTMTTTQNALLEFHQPENTSFETDQPKTFYAAKQQSSINKNENVERDNR